MNHSIEHEVLIDGIIYRVLKEDDFDEALNFYFDVFLKGNNQQIDLISYGNLVTEGFFLGTF